LQIKADFFGEVLSKLLNLRTQLLVPNFLIFLLLRACWDSLPWKLAFNEVEEDVAERLEIISPCLFNSQMCVYRGIPCSSSQVLSISVWDMLSCLWISKPLRKTEINYVNVVLLLADTDQEVVWFYVSVQEMPTVDKLDPLQHLISKHQDCFQAEFTLAVVK